MEELSQFREFAGLPNDYGRKGKGFTPPTEQLAKAKRFFCDNASVFGLALALIGLAI